MALSAALRHGAPLFALVGTHRSAGCRVGAAVSHTLRRSVPLAGREAALLPYVPALARTWLADAAGEHARILEGTLAFVDISGFTRLTEMLAAQGKSGAEELTGVLDAIFADLLALAYERGGELIKWGGDAVLVWFSGDRHADRALAAAWQMQRTMRRIGRVRTSAGSSTLRMSVGIHSGWFHFFSVGSLHRELLVTGPSPTVTAHMEAVAEAGEIVVSRETLGYLDPRTQAVEKADGMRITALPRQSLLSEALGDGRGRPSLSLPAALQDHLAAGPVESEHRQVAVAFIEFGGVDALLSTEGEETVAVALEDLITRIQECCVLHGVTFWETDIAEDGGKVMLVAGAPSATDDDAGRILVTLREVLDGGGRLRLRAGASFGRVFTGGFGPSYRRTYSAKGDAVNLAARLMARAAAGELYASDLVVERSRVRFACEELEPFLVKGKARPVHAHRVGAARSAARAGGGGLHIVGRERELYVLGDQLDRARTGSGGAVELVGDAGIGKSRLIEEVESLASCMRVVDIVCDEYRSLLPYGSMSVLVRHCLGVDADADPAGVAEALLDVVDRLAPDLSPWTPLLAAAARTEVPPTAESTALDERFRRERLAESVLRLLSVTLNGPTLLLIDDAQWMDDASAAVVERLASEAEARPWLVVVARRPGREGLVLEAVSGVTRLEIEPLSEGAVGALLAEATLPDVLAPHHRDTLLERSAGNPLFLLELLEAGRHAGFDRALPDTVEGLFAAQIDGLSPPDRRLLRVASVLGMQVALPVLGDMLDEDLDLAGLDDFLEPDAPDTLRFRHNMLRDAAYEGLPFARRRQLHALAGEVLERRAGASSAEIAGLLALHFGHAGRNREAWSYARLAADRARAVYANVEAVSFLEQALEAARPLGDIPAGDLLSVTEALGDSRTRLGEFGAAAETYRSARRWASTATERAQLHYKVALSTERSSEYALTLRMLTLAERSLGEDDSMQARRLRAHVHTQYGLVRYRQGKVHEAVELLRGAVALAEAAEAPDVVATALIHLDMAEFAAGVVGETPHAEQALEIQRGLGENPWLEARALNTMGERAYFAGRWTEATAYYEESKQACERAGDRWTAAAESQNIAEVLSDQGQLDEAEEMLEEALGVYRAAGTAMFVADCTRMLGRVAARRGDAARASELLAAAREIFAANKEAFQVQLTDAIRAESLLLAGETGDACSLAEQVLSDLEGSPGRHLVAPLVERVLGAGLGLLGADEARARAMLVASIETARHHDARYEVAMSLQALSDLWPEMDDAELAERDALFGELGIAESARRITPVCLPVDGVS